MAKICYNKIQLILNLNRRRSMQERQTRQKSIIYDALKTLDHPTATEVYGYVHERHPSVSRATVFRVLGGFAQTGRALELRMGGKATSATTTTPAATTTSTVVAAGGLRTC